MALFSLDQINGLRIIWKLLIVHFIFPMDVYFVNAFIQNVSLNLRKILKQQI